MPGNLHFRALRAASLLSALGGLQMDVGCIRGSAPHLPDGSGKGVEPAALDSVWVRVEALMNHDCHSGAEGRTQSGTIVSCAIPAAQARVSVERGGDRGPTSAVTLSSTGVEDLQRLADRYIPAVLGESEWLRLSGNLTKPDGRHFKARAASGDWCVSVERVALDHRIQVRRGDCAQP